MFGNFSIFIEEGLNVIRWKTLFIRSKRQKFGGSHEMVCHDESCAWRAYFEPSIKITTNLTTYNKVTCIHRSHVQMYVNIF